MSWLHPILSYLASRGSRAAYFRRYNKDRREYLAMKMREYRARA